MFERDIFIRLREWASGEKHKPLILRGARQVGKTTVVHEFGKEFDDYLYLNLEREKDAAIFDGTGDVQDIMQAIYFLKRKQKREGRTLLLLMKYNVCLGQWHYCVAFMKICRKSM